MAHGKSDDKGGLDSIINWFIHSQAAATSQPLPAGCYSDIWPGKPRTSWYMPQR
jgi:hypothetical protein